MSELQFLASLILLGITYVFRGKIIRYINIHLAMNHIKFKLNNKYLIYFLSFLFALVLILGMVTGTKVHKTYGNVKDGFEKISPKDKPHPWFDIDTYW